MPRRVYTERDQARAAVLLQGNQGNITRTARDLGIPKGTVQDWKRKWEMEGYPEKVEEVLPAVREAVLDDFKRIVTLSVVNLLEALETNRVPTKELSWIALNFTDKIRLIQGEPTSRTETVQSLPDAKELAKELATFVVDTVSAAKERTELIEDAIHWEEANKALSLA